MKFVFENKSKTPFMDCTGDEMKVIVSGVVRGHVDFFSGSWQEKDKSDLVCPAGIYRVRKPLVVPNQISWWIVPPEYKYSFTNKDNLMTITTRVPVEKQTEAGGFVLAYSGKGKFAVVPPGWYGSWIGTVESIDSLLVRPIEVDK